MSHFVNPVMRTLQHTHGWRNHRKNNLLEDAETAFFITLYACLRLFHGRCMES